MIPGLDGGEEMHILKLAPVLMIAALVTACGDKPNPVATQLARGSYRCQPGHQRSRLRSDGLHDGVHRDRHAVRWLHANGDAFVVQQRRQRCHCRQRRAP